MNELSGLMCQPVLLPNSPMRLSGGFLSEPTRLQITEGPIHDPYTANVPSGATRRVWHPVPPTSAVASSEPCLRSQTEIVWEYVGWDSLRSAVTSVPFGLMAHAVRNTRSSGQDSTFSRC